MLQSTKLLKYNTAVYYYPLHCNAPSPTPYPLHYWAGCFHLTTWPSNFHHGRWMAPHPSNAPIEYFASPGISKILFTVYSSDKSYIHLMPFYSNLFNYHK